MIKKLMQSAMALNLAFGVVATSMQPAEARGGAGVAVGVAAGLIGLGILGAAANAGPRYYASEPACYKGRERCGWTDRHCFINSYGDEVCRGGRYTCWRPTYCD